MTMRKLRLGFDRASFGNIAKAVLATFMGAAAACSSGEGGDAGGGNATPTASAGADASVAEGTTVTLNASGSNDPDGAIQSYQWAQTAGPSVTLSGATNVSASFQAPDVEATASLSFTVTVTDNSGASATDRVDITVNAVAARVATTAGFVQGESAGGVDVYRGVAYAAPPTGDRRWRPPSAPTPWSDVRGASQFGVACPQFTSSFAVGGLFAGLTDEDCLSLNVWTPATSAADALPVMVQIHGGGFNTGASSIVVYDGGDLAADEDVVVVSMNYRLGPLGFFSHPALNAEAASGASGNFGLMDLILALEWVRDNIDRFGGDPTAVTLFGQSAGAQAVCMLMTSPAAAGLFVRGAMQSGNCPGDLRSLTQSGPSFPDSANAQGEAAAQALGCGGAGDVLACLRGLSAQDILNGLNPAPTVIFSTGDNYIPVVDGDILPDQPLARIAAGESNVNAAIVGSTRNEISFWRSAYAADVGTVADYLVALEAFDEDADAVLNGPSATLATLYPAAVDSDALPAYERFLTDLTFTCEVRRTTRAMADAGLSVFAFEFARTAPILGSLGAAHAADLPYLPGDPPLVGYASADRTLADQMQAYWASFARRPRRHPWRGRFIRQQANNIFNWTRRSRP